MSYFCFLFGLNPLNYENHKNCDCVEGIKNPPNDLNNLQVAGIKAVRKRYSARRNYTFRDPWRICD